MEVPPIPAGLAAANIDDPNTVAEKLLEADLRFLDVHAYVRAHFATPRPARGPRWPSEGPPERLVYLLDHEYTQKGLAWGRLKNGDTVRAALLREVADRLDCEIVLALADVYESWSCEDDWGYDGFGYGRRTRRWQYDDYDVPANKDETKTTRAVSAPSRATAPRTTR